MAEPKLTTDGAKRSWVSAVAAPAPKREAMAERLKLALDYDQLTNCMRCGFCLPACPTFRETGVEAESPRGRIALMKAVADGIMSPDRAFEEQMNHCLGCRACEPACPADVKYGHLIEQAREAVEETTDSHRWWVRAVRKAAFRGLFPHQNRLRLLGKTLKLYQRTGLREAVRRSGVLKLLPPQLADMERVLPDASGDGVVARIGAAHPARGERIAKVGLFRGCVMDVLFTETNVNTVKLLTAAGFDVVIPDAQNCCGALHAHAGDADAARALARSNVRTFKEAGVDYIVSNAGGCGAAMVEYGHLLQGDAEAGDDAKWFASRVVDVADLLVRRGRELSFEGTDVRITYQDSCHLRNVMRSSDAPRKLMKRVGGAELCEMKEADRCCGSAGIYNITQPEMASQILAHKMEHANATRAERIVTSNPGCLLQMKLGVEKHGAGERTEAVHLVDFLAERLRIDSE